jgi:hypothetical protein
MSLTITVRGPEWFFGLDSLLECFSALAMILVTLFSFKAYRFTKDKRYRTFAIGFGLMALGTLLRAASDLAVYFDLNIKAIWLMAGYGLYMASTLASMVVLFALTLKTHQKAPFVALLLISFVLVLLSASYRLSFHAISIILLAFIAYHFIRNYFAKKSLNALLVCVSFVLLTLAHTAFIVDIIKQRFYIVGHLLHVAAFALLLFALIKVLKNR